MKTLTIITMGLVLTGCASQDGYLQANTPKITVPVGQDAKYGSLFFYLTFGWISPDAGSGTEGQK
jgi:uncharacterized lipoprotein YajG